jgi:glycosyltransferase involved in cell wall biosynthesis
MFVDDASTDSTWQRIHEARERNARVRGLKHQRNAGQSAALWTGILATETPVIVTLDGDRQNDPTDLPRLLSELKEVDFVCGVRTKRNDDWLRRVSSRVARAARKKALGVDFRDTGCAFRAFRREAIDGVFPFNGVHRFLPVLVHSNGARTKEIPIGHRARVSGVSKYGMWNRLFRGIYDLIAISWYQKRRLPRIQTIALSGELAANRVVSRNAAELEPVSTR